MSSCNCYFCNVNKIYLNSVPDDEHKKCLLCDKALADIRFVPCQHQMLCQECFLKKYGTFARCPYCGENINASRRVDLTSSRAVFKDITNKNGGSMCHLDDEVKRCLICERAFATLTFYPCNHVLLCVSCYRKKQFSFAHCTCCGTPVETADNIDYTADPEEQVSFSNEGHIFVL